jgi:hypothetical protein
MTAPSSSARPRRAGERARHTAGARTRADIVAVVAVLVVVLVVGAASGGLAGCPDPCVLGGGCNTSADCGDGEVCRIPRDHEWGCFVVRGTCLADDGKRQAALCGSVDDCGDGECCDPRWNRCVRAELFVGPTCDDATCPDCDAADLRAECSGRNDCPANQVCDGALDDDDGLCADICVTSADCKTGQLCKDERCTVSIGTPCIADDERAALVGIGSVPQQDRCHGLTCSALDARGNHVDPYCTDNCTLDEDKEVCDAIGFTCDDNKCMRP